MKALKWLDDNIEEFFLVILLVLISVVMLAQIFARYVFNSSMSWPEEFCRYCYVWTVFLSVSYTIKRGNMLRVGVVMDLFPTWIQSLVKIICNAICVALFVVFFQHSFQVISNIKNVTREISAAMQVPMWIMYLSTAIAFGLGAIRSVEAIIDNIRNFHAKALSTIEATVQDAQAEVDLLKKDEGGNK